MKDLYTFDTTEKAALATYQLVRAEYRNFFEALGVPYVEVEASSGNMGGSLSHEYHFLSPLGEDTIIICESCGFAANEEILPKKAESQYKHQCPRCTGSKISTHRAIEIGHTFHLGTRYTEPLGVSTSLPTTAQSPTPPITESGTQGVDISVQANSTSRVPLQMGCHGVGVSRLIGAVAAMTADEKGLSWPPVMAPYHVVVVFDGPKPPTNPDFPEILNHYSHFANRIGGIKYQGPWGTTVAPHISIVFDDRDRPLPWKLKDADLTGYPIIIVVGKSFKQSGKYEIQCRSSPQLSVTSDALAISVLDILNEATPKITGQKPPWRFGSGTARYLTPEEYSTWKNKQNSEWNGDPTKEKNSKVLTKSEQDAIVGTVMKPTLSLAQNAGTREAPQTMAEFVSNVKFGKQGMYKSFTPSNSVNEANMAQVSPGSRERIPLRKQERSPESLDNPPAPQYDNPASAEDERPKRDPRPIDPESLEPRANAIKNGMKREKAQRKTVARDKRQLEELSQSATHYSSTGEGEAPGQSPRPSKRYEAPPPPSPAPVQQQPTQSHAPVLSHEHLLERVTLLERLMALKAEEDMLKKQGGK